MEWSPVANIWLNSRCCLFESLGCLPRSFPLAQAIAMASQVRMLIRSTSSSAKIAYRRHDDRLAAPEPHGRHLCLPPTAQIRREEAHNAQRLEMHLNTLRPMRSYMHGHKRHLLVMPPEPRSREGRRAPIRLANYLRKSCE